MLFGSPTVSLFVLFQTQRSKGWTMQEKVPRFFYLTLLLTACLVSSRNSHNSGKMNLLERQTLIVSQLAPIPIWVEHGCTALQLPATTLWWLCLKWNKIVAKIKLCLSSYTLLLKLLNIWVSCFQFLEKVQIVMAFEYLQFRTCTIHMWIYSTKFIWKWNELLLCFYISIPCCALHELPIILLKTKISQSTHKLFSSNNWWLGFVG